MNPVVEKFMEVAKELGYIPSQIRDDLREAALDIIHEKYRSEFRSLKDCMRKMNVCELKAIVDEIEEGGKP